VIKKRRQSEGDCAEEVKDVLTENKKNESSTCLFTAFADMAMNRNCDIRDYSGDHYGRVRTFEAELSEYLEEPLLTDRSLKQL
jgi:hypothetical protein